MKYFLFLYSAYALSVRILNIIAMMSVLVSYFMNT